MKKIPTSPMRDELVQALISNDDLRKVNVGTVGHVDHGTSGYRTNPADYPSSMPYYDLYHNPRKPEWINWNNGLIKVAGRIIHNLSERTRPEPVMADHNDDPNANLKIARVMRKYYWALEETVYKPLDIGKLLGNTDVDNEQHFADYWARELLADRRSVIPSRRAIAWAFQMANWKNTVIERLDAKQIEGLLNGK